MMNIFALMHAKAESRITGITGKLKEWEMIDHDCY